MSVWHGLLVGVALIASQPAYAADEGSRASRTARQLVGAQLQSGQFAFEYDFVLGGRRPMAYITREAAAAYGLSNYFLYEQDAGVARALAAVLRNL